MNESTKLSRPRFRGNSAHRRGVAAAEFAVCLPVFLLLVFGMIESCSMIFLKQTLTVAAYEGARTALEENAVAADVRTVCEQVLSDRRVQGGTIAISPTDFQRLPPGDYISITVSAPADSNSIIRGSFFNGRTLSSTATMMKEL